MFFPWFLFFSITQISDVKFHAGVCGLYLSRFSGKCHRPFPFFVIELYLIWALRILFNLVFQNVLLYNVLRKLCSLSIFLILNEWLIKIWFFRNASWNHTFYSLWPQRLCRRRHAPLFGVVVLWPTFRGLVVGRFEKFGTLFCRCECSLIKPLLRLTNIQLLFSRKVIQLIQILSWKIRCSSMSSLIEIHTWLVHGWVFTARSHGHCVICHTQAKHIISILPFHSVFVKSSIFQLRLEKCTSIYDLVVHQWFSILPIVVYHIALL